MLPRFEHSLKDQKPISMLSGGNGPYCFVKKTSRDYGIEKPSFFEKVLPPITINHTRTCAEKRRK